MVDFLVLDLSEVHPLSQDLLQDLSIWNPSSTAGVDIVLTAIVSIIIVPTFLNHSGVKSAYYPPKI